MKRSVLTVAAVGALCASAAVLSACGITATGDVSYPGKTVSMSTQMFISQSDLDMVKSLQVMSALGGESFDMKDLGIDVDKLDKVTIDGKEYYTSTREADGLFNSAKLTKKDLENAGAIFDDDKLVMYSPAMPDDASALDASMLGGNDAKDFIDFATVKLTFDKTPVATNGTLEGNVVTYDNLADETIWAAFTDKPLKATAASIKSSVKNKAHTKKDTVTYTTPGIVCGYTVDGKDRGPGAVDTASGSKANTVEFTKQGKHTVTVKLTSGAARTFKYVYDTKAPKANVKAGKSYKRGKKLSVTDKFSLKSVKLNGKKVKVVGKKAKVKLKKSGTNKLTAKDKAGNKLTVKFKVK